MGSGIGVGLVAGLFETWLGFWENGTLGSSESSPLLVGRVIGAVDEVFLSATLLEGF